MGCDIHLFVEVRDAADKPWRLQRVTWMREPPEGKLATDESLREVGYNDRNYNVFAILADVRNPRNRQGPEYIEFRRSIGIPDAGWWGDQAPGFNPISEPRGLPEDMSEGIREVLADMERLNDDWDGERYDELKARWGATNLGDHSESWLTLRELLDFNWNQRTNEHGVVTAAQFRVYLDHGTPNQWASSVGGHGVVTLPEDVMRKYVEACTFAPDYETNWHSERPVSSEWSAELVQLLEPYGITPMNHRQWTIVCNVKWSVSYKEASYDFYKKFIPALALLGFAPENVRIVFGFDS